MPEPTIVKYGNDLLTEKVQPGWNIDSDGFGLLQSTVTFKMSRVYIGTFTTQFFRGAPHPSPLYPQLKMWRATMTENEGDIITIRADYCGLDASVAERGYTEPQVQMTGAAASESIQSHPNFVRINCTSLGEPGTINPLAGYPPPGGGINEDNPNRPAWGIGQNAGGLINNFQFVGFLPNQVETDETPNIKAGIKSYYKPQNTLRVLIYFNNQEAALDRASLVGWVTSGSSFYLPDAYKKLATGGYAGEFLFSDEWNGQIHKSFLITNCSVELFGTIYKVTADLMISGISGWDKDLYPVSIYG
jgi:hypothetical protein